VSRAPARRKLMSIALMPGSRLPTYCTSMGRVLLAALPEDKASNILRSSALRARIPSTLVDQHAIMAELERVRRQGFATTDQEVETGLRSIGADCPPRRLRLLLS
jgi:IclR family pca regulon transcriptional regulator